MTIQLYGNPMSTCTKRVAIVLKELGIGYKFHFIDFEKGEHKAPSFLEHQPFGQVPYIVDNGNDNFELFESRAITNYLVRTYGSDSGLIPKDPKKLAKFEQAASIESANFDAHVTPILFEKVFGPMQGHSTNEAAVKSHATILESKLDAYEKILGKSRYLGGEEITLADLAHLPKGALIAQIGFAELLTSDRHPNVTRWWNDLTSRASWLSIQDGV